MKRKIIKNRHQYKVSLPIELVRKLGWGAQDHDAQDNNSKVHASMRASAPVSAYVSTSASAHASTCVIFHEVNTPQGRGMLILKENDAQETNLPVEIIEETGKYGAVKKERALKR